VINAVRWARVRARHLVRVRVVPGHGRRRRFMGEGRQGLSPKLAGATVPVPAAALVPVLTEFYRRMR